MFYLMPELLLFFTGFSSTVLGVCKTGLDNMCANLTIKNLTRSTRREEKEK